VWDADYPWDIRTEKIARSLTAAGHEIHIVARNRRRSTTREELAEGIVHRMRPWRLVGKRLDDLLGFPAFFSPRWLRLVRRVVREVSPDVVIVRDLPLCPTAIWASRAFGVPVVFDMAENYPALLQDVWDTHRQGRLDFLLRNPRAAAFVERYSLPRVDRVVTVVEESAERVQALGVPTAKISVISNTPSVRSVTAAERRAPALNGALTIVYMGLMEVARGVGVALEAMRLLRGGSTTFRLRLIGGGRDFDLLRARARELDLSDEEVEFLGYVPDHQEALGLVRQSDIGLIPHLAIGWANTTIPNKLFDYMAAGLPVVTSDSLPCARIVAQCGSGTVFPSGDPTALAASLRSLTDFGLRREYSARGRQAILERYNWEMDSARLLTVLQEVVLERS
jgi:glycosyltransferase involved in cell wall biosynthesis